jgi:hypothetical protein
LTVSEACLVGQPDLLRLAQDEGEEPERERHHQADSTAGKKRKRLEKPDEGVLELPGPGDGSEEDGVAKENGQPKGREPSKPKTFPADGNRIGYRRSRSESDLKKKEDEKEDQPAPEVP